MTWQERTITLVVKTRLEVEGEGIVDEREKDILTHYNYHGDFQLNNTIVEVVSCQVK